MPSDIRSFFGGKPSQSTPQKHEKQTKQVPKRGKGRKVLEDSEDEDSKPSPKRATPKKAAASKKREPSPEGEALEASEYFGKSKPKRSAGNKSNGGITKDIPKTPPKASKSQATPTRSSGRTKKPVDYSGDHVDKPAGSQKAKDDEEERDDIFVADFKKGGKKDDDYEEGSDAGMMDVDGADDVKPEQPRKGRAAAASTAKKRKSDAVQEDPQTPKKKPKAPRKSPSKKENEPEDAAMQDIFASIPTIRPPTPTEGGGPKKPFNPRAHHANSGPAPAAGSKEIPVGAENCLAGLSFCFTGLLPTISREDGAALVKRYGGRVVGQPSKKTSYVVLGSDAGPSKIKTIKANGITTIDEDGLHELLRKMPANGGSGKAAAEHEKKQEAEMEKVKKQAAEAEAEDKKAQKIAKKDGVPESDSRLWTVKHAPTQMNQICGNKGQVEKLQRWLRAFPKNQKTKFKLAGADGSGIYRAVMIHGPPGIGKTTAAHLVAQIEGYDVVETNASDSRSKKLVEQGLRGVLSTTSLFGYFAGEGEKVDMGKKNLVLIMDEVDGMSAGDRGGVGALAAVCKKTQIPMILVCNDRKLPKMKPFDGCTYDLAFRRPTADQIKSRLMTIAFREGVKIPGQVLNALVEGSRSDIRQVINMISTAKLDDKPMDFDEGKKMSQAWEKHVVLKPWDIVTKILRGELFQPAAKKGLNDKAELYFNDHEFAPLMLQENYLNTTPMGANDYKGRDKLLKVLELTEKASESISDGDLVDRVIHGPQQHWSLMPTHAIFSFVRPASYVCGPMSDQPRFTSWLGKNSSQGKLIREIREVQGHMRLKTSADRHAIRQEYLPLLWSHLIKRLQVEGKDAVEGVIDRMDSYYLTKEDWDALLELGVGPMDQEKVKLETQTKATFTRLYNSRSHPLPFIKASSIGDPRSRAAAPKEKPDLEEAMEESDEGEVVDPAADDEEEGDVDLSKDKYVKQAKKTKAKGKAKADEGAGAAAKGKGKGKGNGKAKKGDEDDEMDNFVADDEDEPPAKKKGGGRKKKA